MTTYRDAAGAGCKRLLELWTELSREEKPWDPIGQGFWHAGNTLRTCIRYLLIDAAAAKDSSIVEDSYALFDRYRDKDPDPAKWSFWRDDYGWWGLSLLAAYNNSSPLHLSDSERYLTAAHLCWQGLRAAWDDAGGGGCWNDPPNGRKNSVTNEMFWLLSLALLQTPNAPAEDYRGWASKSREWFSAWRQKGELKEPNGLVFETPGMKDDWVWTGDQGLYISACVFSEELLGAPDGYTEARSVADAVFTHLVDGQGVLHEPPGPSGGYDVDYATGKGVFFRHISNLAISAAYAERTKASAAAVWNHARDPASCQFGFNWNPDDKTPHEPVEDGSGLWPITLQTAGQDVLNAAAQIAPGEAIPPS